MLPEYRPERAERGGRHFFVGSERDEPSLVKDPFTNICGQSPGYDGKRNVDCG